MVLKAHHLRPAPGAKTAKTRVGRGEASKGKTAGRGTKGTGARKNVPAAFEGGQMPLHMRLPKLRGFSNPFRVEYQVVNVGKLAELFPAGGKVTVADLVEKGAVRLTHHGKQVRLDKPSRCVHPGDDLVFALNGRVTAVRIEALGERRGPPAEARALYSPLGEDVSIV